MPHLSNGIDIFSVQFSGVSYLQEGPVFRLLLLHLLQQLLDLYSQLSLQFWLDDKVQRGRKRRAQRVNMALQPRIEEAENSIIIRKQLATVNLQYTAYQNWLFNTLKSANDCKKKKKKERSS